MSRWLMLAVAGLVPLPVVEQAPGVSQAPVVKNSAQAVRAHVTSGTLVGSVDDAVKVFKGIPYAAPPVGPLEFKLPQPATSWSGERAANEFGASCSQRFTPRNVEPNTPAAKLSEDCLTLNIWAPRDAKKAAVMVWIHGGGNQNGSAAIIYYNGTAFARDGVVLVSLNYRLGEQGFAAHGGEANFGLWDQVAALEWVHDNIAVFGGDAANVTLFGESAGGQDILALMTAAPAQRLFHKAIVESGGGGWDTPALSKPDDNGDWGVVVDGHLLKEPPLQAFAAGHAAHIPLIIGTNSGEGSLLGPQPKSENVFPKLAQDDLAKLKALYGDRASSDEALARLVFRDGYFAGEARWVAARANAAGAPAYLYRFEHVLSALQGHRVSAFHGSEIPFVFNRMPDAVRADDTDMRVERALHDCWVAFARTGKPACAEAPQWPAFEPGEQWMVFDDHPSARMLEGTAALDLLQCRLAAGLAPAGCPAK